MTSQQVAILNSLVTFAAENVPGGLSEEEREVALIVGDCAINDKVLVDIPMKHVPALKLWADVALMRL